MDETQVGLKVLQWFVGILSTVIIGLGTVIGYLFRTGRNDLIKGYKREERLVEANDLTAQALHKVVEQMVENNKIVSNGYEVAKENAVKLEVLADRVKSQDESIQRMADRIIQSNSKSASATRKRTAAE